MNIVGEYSIGGGAGGSENKGILGALDSQRTEVQFCDVTLHVEGEKFPAHRCVLAAASPYFSSMFEEYNFSESRKTEVELKSVSSVAMQVILDMIYSGTLKLNVDTMHQVLCAGDHFLMNEVKFACTEFMLMILNSENAPDEAIRIRRSAALYDLTDLEHEADRVITRTFSKVANSASFSDLTDQELMGFLQSDYIQEREEQVFWRAAIEWINHDLEMRSHHLDKLMDSVRFPLIDAHDLLTTVSEHPIMAKSDRCKELIEEAMKYQLLGNLQSGLQSQRTKPRCTTQNTILYCLSGNNFKCYIPSYDKWYALASPMPSSVTGDHSWTNLSHTDTSSMISERYLVTVNGLAYVCTQATRPEETGHFELIRMQEFTMNTNTWRECSLPKRVSVPTFLIECNAELYACSRNAVERYIVERDIWEAVSISRLSPCQFAISVDNRILLYSLEEGVCQEMCMDRPNMVTTRQVMSPNRFISEVISATKLSNHEVFLSLRTLSGISRKIFNVRSNLWRDAGIFHGGTTCSQPRPGQHFPHWMNPAEPWLTIGDRNTNSLFILATKSGMSDIPHRTTSSSSPRTEPGSSSTQDTTRKVLSDAVMPFFHLDLTKKTWKRLAALPEFMEQKNLSMSISDGACSMGSAIVL